MARLLDAQTGRLLIENLNIAESAWDSFRGLLGRNHLDPQEALLLKQCRFIHMFFMRFAIDAAFLSEDWTVLKITPRLQVWRLAGCPGAAHTLEMAEGAAEKLGLKVGDKLKIE